MAQKYEKLKGVGIKWRKLSHLLEFVLKTDLGKKMTCKYEKKLKELAIK